MSRIGAILLAAMVIASGDSTRGQRETCSLSEGDHSVKLNGITFPYRVAGAGPVLIIQSPGWGIGSSYLRNGLAGLAAHHTVVTFEPRGTGVSAQELGGASLSARDLVDDLEALRAYFQLSTFDLLGHSNGGMISIAYAETYPARVAKLVLVGSELAGYKDVAGTRALRDSMRKESRYTEAFAHMEDSTANDEEFTVNFKRTSSYYLFDPARFQSVFNSTVTNTMTRSATSIYSRLSAKRPMPALDGLSAIRARTLIIVGREDPCCTVGVSQRIREGIPHATLSIYEQTGHFPWIEDPTRFFSEVDQFLRP